jgi:Ras family protein A
LGGNNAAPQGNDDPLPPYSLPLLKDSSQPFVFHVQIRGKPLTFLFCDTSSPENYTLLHPDFIVICYDISNRSSLNSIKTRWKAELDTNFNYDERVPTMVLGLKRDLRREWTVIEKQNREGATIMPQEAIQVAQEMRCDIYAECSALTGDLFREAVEDIAKTAVKTVRSPSGGKSEGGCVVM